jgi:hypothetical protein
MAVAPSGDGIDWQIGRVSDLCIFRCLTSTSTRRGLPANGVLSLQVDVAKLSLTSNELSLLLLVSESTAKKPR